jgi:glycosyltransferase involved in cell wall biosynthesis
MKAGRQPLVVIDARGYFTGGGIGRYTRSLVAELAARRGRGASLRLLISNQHRPADLDAIAADDVEVVVSRAGWMHEEEEERYLPAEVAGADLFHSLDGHWLPHGQPAVATLLDLIPVVRPSLVPRKSRTSGQRIARTIARAAHVIAISEATARDARQVLGARMPPVSVVHLAAAPSFRRDVPAGNALWRYGLLARGFMLAVSAVNPHKNLTRLVEAYAEAGVAAPLLIVGAQREATADVERAVQAHGLTGRVKLMGRVTDEDLAALYASCRAFVYPSLYEGFGLPLVEAMACGAAVVASNSSSIPEVTGGAALLVDSTQTASLAEALRRVDGEPALRRDLRTRASARARDFSWTHTATATLAVYTRQLKAQAAA